MSVYLRGNTITVIGSDERTLFAVALSDSSSSGLLAQMATTSPSPVTPFRMRLPDVQFRIDSRLAKQQSKYLTMLRSSLYCEG